MPAASGAAVSRRRVLRTLCGLGAIALSGISALLPARLWARPTQSFAASTQADAMRALFADAGIVPSDEIELELPALAEDGAVVPISIRSTLAQIESVSIFSDKNPVPLIAHWRCAPALRLLPLSTRIKLAEMPVVTVVICADGKLFSAQQAVRVSKGGCT